MDPALMQMLQGGGGLGGLGGGSSKTLVSFKAGRMDYDGKMVTPDRRKGLIRVIKNLMTHETQFQWCDPDTEQPVESLYIFPGDAKFEKVKQSKDRVYLLEMIPTQKRNFYWMQEEEPEKDAERCKAVHDALNGVEVASKPEEVTPGKESVSQPASTPQSSAAPNQGVSAAEQAYLNQLMAQFSGAQMNSRPKPEDQSPELQQILTQDNMLKLVRENPDVRKALLEHLPEGQQTDENLEANLLSSQLQGAMRTLSETINSDQAEIILASCGLDSKHLKDSSDGMEGLMNALIEKHSKPEDKDKKDKDGDADMK